MVAPAVILGLRAVQVLLSIIVLGLTAYLVWQYSGPYNDWVPSSIVFMLFTSIWTLFTVAYLWLAPTKFPRFAHKFAIAAVEFITMLFWFAAFVAVATLWGQTVSSVWYLRHTKFYECGVAAIVFGAVIWLTFVATTALAALNARGTGTSRGTAAPATNMAAV